MPRKIQINPEEVLARMEETGELFHEVAEALGVCYWTLRCHLAEHGVPPLTREETGMLPEKRWSRAGYTRCRGCNDPGRPHFAKGLCEACYSKLRRGTL